MKDRVAHALAWFRKAESDIKNARRTIASDGPFDTACFHVQQAAEKYLKGLLAFHDQPIPKTHDIEELQKECLSFIPHSTMKDMDLTVLTDYAVDARYDFDFWPDQTTAEESLQLAERIRALVLDVMPKEAQPEN